MTTFGQKCVYWILCLSVLQDCVKMTPVSDSGSASESDPSGEFLVQLGANYSSPLLRLLGKTFKYYEKTSDQRLKDAIKTSEQRLTDVMGTSEKRLTDAMETSEQRLTDAMETSEKRLTETIQTLHPCTEWGSWTSCPAVVQDRFSMKTRSRNCSRTDTASGKIVSADLPTTDSKVCEGWCPHTYGYTKGFCLKLFTTKMTQYDAQAVCEEDKGHLVHIDTKLKSDVVHEVLSTDGFTSTVWINGNRSQAGGDWSFTHGSVPNFDNWKSGEPSNGAQEMCKVDEYTRKWRDKYCLAKYAFVCEKLGPN